MVARLTYPTPLVDGWLIRRYKRFLADVRLPGGEVVTAHCANTGSMHGIAKPDAPCRLSVHDDPKRKLKYSLEQICVDGDWVMVNTAKPNRVVEAAIAAGDVAELTGYDVMQRERPYGQQNSRIDLLLLDGGDVPAGSPARPSARVARRACYVEVKNVTLLDGHVARFPDAVTKRGTKHLAELEDVVRSGHRGVLLFHVARSGGEYVAPARAFDPTYADALAHAAAAGVEVLAYRCLVHRGWLGLGESLAVRL